MRLLAFLGKFPQTHYSGATFGLFQLLKYF